MRKKIIKQMSLFDGPIFDLIPFVRRERILKKMDAVIEANPRLVNLVYADITQNKTQTGRHGLSAEQVLRTAILRQLKGCQLARAGGTTQRRHLFEVVQPHIYRQNSTLHLVAESCASNQPQDMGGDQ